MKQKILFLGRLTIDNTPCAGEVMKNRLFCNRIESVGCQIKKINLTLYKGRLLRFLLLLKLVFELVFHSQKRIIVSTYDEYAIRILNILGRYGKSHKTIYWVIGGGLSRRIEKGELKCKHYKELDRIIVEDVSIQEHMNAMGFNNVISVPNFKPIVKINKKDSIPNNRFVFVSRITPLKGCDIILSAVRELKRKNISVEVDFYGFIEKGYPFEEYIESLPNVHYKGVLSLNSADDYEFLAGYTALLFPTYYPNEGFPGVLIDGFIAGLPIISTDWRYNSHIIEVDKQGWLLPIQDSSNLASVMENVINNKYNLREISDCCLKKACDYDTITVLSESFLSQLSLI